MRVYNTKPGTTGQPRQANNNAENGQAQYYGVPLQGGALETTVNAPCSQVDFKALQQSLESKRLNFLCKRIFDIAVSTVLLLVLLPLFAPVALGIKLSSPGPVIYRQVRYGLGGRPFVLYKFRSMWSTGDMEADVAHLRNIDDDAEPDLSELFLRRTAFGVLLRKSSIDELPQLFNVLKGDMSLVGPRPVLPFMVVRESEVAALRALVKPGITGLWQVRARRSNTGPRTMFPNDLEYLHRFSFLLDLRILAQTIPVVLSGRGAE